MQLHFQMSVDYAFTTRFPIASAGSAAPPFYIRQLAPANSSQMITERRRDFLEELRGGGRRLLEDRETGSFIHSRIGTRAAAFCEGDTGGRADPGTFLKSLRTPPAERDFGSLASISRLRGRCCH